MASPRIKMLNASKKRASSSTCKWLVRVSIHRTWVGLTLLTFLVLLLVVTSLLIMHSIPEQTTATSAGSSSSFLSNVFILEDLPRPPAPRLLQEKENHNYKYVAADVETYIMDHFEELGFDSTLNPKGCPIWFTPEVSTQENYNNLRAFRQDIDNYTKILKEFDKTVPDFVRTIREQSASSSINQVELCKVARLHPDGIQALFPSGQLSSIPSNSGGYVEPLLTPMRHPAFCDDHQVGGSGGGGSMLMSMDYLIHDFEQMCLNLRPSSRSILVDMGASLEFHSSTHIEPPVVTLLKRFEKFGFHFDHIYAFEVTDFDPKKVYRELLPEKYFPSYHWINTGISAEVEDRLNPLRSIVSKFNEDDLVIVKLDVDDPSLELPLAQQLLKDNSLNKLVDHFYFEHHVHMGEIADSWGDSMEGTIQESFELMNGLRQKGVASHFWV